MDCLSASCLLVQILNLRPSYFHLHSLLETLLLSIIFPHTVFFPLHTLFPSILLCCCISVCVRTEIAALESNMSWCFLLTWLTVVSNDKHPLLDFSVCVVSLFQVVDIRWFWQNRIHQMFSDCWFKTRITISLNIQAMLMLTIKPICCSLFVLLYCEVSSL